MTPLKMTRRAALAGAGSAILAARSSLAAARPRLSLFLGTSASKGQGLYPLEVAVSTGKMTLGAPNPAIKAATFGAMAHGLHYVVNSADGRLSAYAADPGRGASWTLKADASSHGNDPCNVAVDATGMWIAVANYASTTFSLFRLDAQGLPQEPATIVTDEGNGPNPDRQKGPHPHWVGFSPDNKFFYTVDLGNDTVMGAPFDPNTGIGQRFVAYRADPGEGPRQQAFHPNAPVQYVLAELGNTLTSLRRAADGTLTRIARLSTLPADFSGKSQASHIVVNRAGTRVYTSNRGHNSIAVFETGPDGHLTHLQTIASGGDWPRFFFLHEESKVLLAANQRSGEIVLFRVGSSGRLTATGQQVSAMDTMYIGLM